MESLPGQTGRAHIYAEAEIKNNEQKLGRRLTISTALTDFLLQAPFSMGDSKRLALISTPRGASQPRM